ncbi:uncharacterized protein LOC122086348 [Macadamia integrifolia]|uniref:uncharacterized protein LOC122086348 n=1 Tax=Macadamia integrifolia TaxID=60698 RepID=UPI001C4EF629|nr:uncharacterized protein LOC122086348 [Macadamia integrifolia]
MPQFLQLQAMEAQTQLQLHHIQTLTTRRLNLPPITKASVSTFSRPTRSFSFQNGTRLGLPKSIAPVASSKQILESGLVIEEGAEEDREMKAEEWMELGFDEEEKEEKMYGEKKKGIVEMMEYLEEEAILGSDPGRNPTDYNRRALIFDKSSRVFQALKQRNALG